jgi:RND superfamily putative drug exporter
MGVAEFAKVRCAGPAIGLSLVVVLVASLTLTPALLCLLGRRAFWPMKAPSFRNEPPPLTLWDRLSRQVIDRPVLIWGVAVAVLLPFAVIGLGIRANYRPTSELADSADSVRGMGIIQRHFHAGEVGPLTVLLSSSREWTTDEGRDLIRHLSLGFGRLDNVAEVRSLTQPLGAGGFDLRQATRKFSFALTGRLLNSVTTGHISNRADETIREFYLASFRDADGLPRHVTRLDVVFKADPWAPPSQASLNVIQTWLRERLPLTGRAMTDLNAEVFGVTVNARDLAEVTEADRGRVNALVLLAVFLILVVLVRAPGQAAYLLGSVLFSYWVTLGVTTLMATWLLGRPMFELDWRVSFFLFTILVAVGEDYNILLIKRAMQERERHGADEGMRRALAATGGAITSCGLIMAGTFAALMLAGLGTLVQIGFALAFGVLLDTFVVRPFLVPAFVLLLWRREEDAEALGQSRRWYQPRKVA